MNEQIASSATEAYEMLEHILEDETFENIQSGQYQIHIDIDESDSLLNEYITPKPSPKKKRTVISGTLAKKGRLFWNERFFVLKGRKLYYFDSRDSPKPRNVISIPNALFNYSDSDSWQGSYGFNFYADDRYHSVSVPTAEDQEKWISALTSAGAHFSEHSVSLQVKQKSLYQFTVADIAGRRVDLHKYEQYVSLVMNVASA
mmetsp:Transcript_16710/g.21306  ORF Transcript_16710/g.21306 Transcript_16710/m.21306 type:complete len:202 (-) Transcript_16710:486-1091(-)|eukprot:CAMPEP_0206192064 /NCGR_PEP_ID=MMETSP0166-20121206/5729_1 /ASSEMBLY_ACC=CAM_ASM_000260 /TAXON_ID=95228 /ORGANISM="Vannella robusta, Strain DIVA3 518/3/11/1/6" /LENGTH=201 /DNA_ID=CAMNT_0053608475 /DNA_START=606 /DNA_END=1211 /DNA_ORIENTATION=+